MRRNDLSRLATFVVVAEHGNFSMAAKQLGIKTPTVSQTISALEDGLGVHLFERTTRKVSLTKAGERLLARLRPAFAEIGEAAESVHAERDLATGTLRISMSGTGAEILLAPTLKPFHVAYPQILLDITLDDQQSGLLDGNYDCGIRLGHLIAKKNIEAVPVGQPTRLIAVASPIYLQRSPPINTPQDLKNHHCIRLRNYGQLLTWVFQKGRRKFEVAVSGSLIVNNNNFLVRAVREGLGVGYTTETHVTQDIAAGRLVPLLVEWAVGTQYHLYFPKDRDMSEPLRRLVEFVKYQRNYP